MMQRDRSLLINLLIILISSFLFIPFLGNVHLFDWDEINFAESAREMIITGDYLNVRINYELFWEKPPLFIWMQVLSMKIFGINEFAARFPNALAGILTLLALFNIGKKHFGYKFGLIWIFAYAGSVLPHFYFKSGIIDPWFNLFIFLGIYYFIRYLSDDKRQSKWIIFSAVFIGLGTLTKGPVALLLFLITGFVYLIIKRFKMRISFRDILLYVFTFILIGGFWFILQFLNGNYDILYDFIVYQIRLFNTQDAGHGGFFGYHFVILLFGVFPASIFALKAFRKENHHKADHKESDHKESDRKESDRKESDRKESDRKESDRKEFKQWMMIFFWVVLLLFSIVRTKIVHYSSAAYFPLTFLAAYAILKTESGEYKKSRLITGILLFFSAVFASIIFLIQYIGLNNNKIVESGLIKDDFVNGNLMAQTDFTGFEFLLGVFLIVGILLCIILIKRSYLIRIISVLSISMIFINLTLLIIVPEVEKISQKAAIDFYVDKKTEKPVFTLYGMKSYAHYFYGETEPPGSYKDITAKQRNTYAVCRNIHVSEFEEHYPEFKKLYEKNGFVFWQRF